MAGNHILVIDDSTVISSLLDDFLSEKGFQVSLAGTAEEAYARIRERIPDLIVLDLVLPDVHGLQFCRVLKADPRTHHIPVIMATAKAIEVKDKVEGLKAGADDYVTKPFELAELYERVNAVLRRVELERGRAREFAAAPSEASPAHAEEVSAPVQKVFTGGWMKLLDLLVDPLWTFSSLLEGSVSNKEFRSNLYIVISVPLIFTISRLSKAGPRFSVETMRGLAVTAGVLLVWLALSGVLSMLFSLVGQRTRFKSIASVIGLAMLPLALGRLLDLSYVILGGHPGEFSSDLSLFFSTFPLKSAARFLMEGVDIFALWSAWLAGAGFSIMLGLEKNKSRILAICICLSAIGLGAIWARFH